MKNIKFSSGYKHQLEEAYHDHVGILPKHDINELYFSLSSKGDLKIKRGYAWNGTTCVWDSKRNLRASLVHDSLYQMMRMQLLSSEEWRIESDKIFYSMCVQDGVIRPVAKIYRILLNKFAGFAAKPKKKIQYAPKKPI